ncbi:glycosyltransferase [Arthrobacter sp. TWP1-1]|uniref:glycosyltransferase n=1 Tax=Arthrobacter sp. TWP1-1 TaxID=2804568 RepID=UPI003CEE5F19
MLESEKTSSTRPSHGGFGVIAMAAYRPDYSLFLTQLKSIQNQTHSDFHCLIAVDGEPEPVRDFIESNLDDPRFQVLGFGDRYGFYGNFERVLSHVPATAQWVALSDQDDYWYPQKLEVMLPHLGEHLLVSGQARVVEAVSDRVISVSTNRRNVPLSDLIAQNQVTGGQTVFRRSLLEISLPFPRLETSSQVHDHWLAVCAASSGSMLIIDDVVQDYVQHGGNVLGEVGGGFDPLRSVRRVVALADRFENGHSVRQLGRTCWKLSYGWRQVMVDALEKRLVVKNAEVSGALLAFSSRKKWRCTVAALVSGLRRGNIAMSCLVEFIAGAPGELAGRARVKRGRAGSKNSGTSAS